MDERSDDLILPSRFQPGAVVMVAIVFKGGGFIGNVVAVRFTESKVLYDVLPIAGGEVVRDIDSVWVSESPGPVPC